MKSTANDTIEHSDTRPSWERDGCDSCKDTSPQFIRIRTKYGQERGDDREIRLCRKCSSSNPKWASFDVKQSQESIRKHKEEKRLIHLAEHPRSLESIRSLLNEAYDHLQYCNWGDSWERECAGDLPERIEKALGR